MEPAGGDITLSRLDDQLQSLIALALYESLEVAPARAQPMAPNVLASVLEKIESNERHRRFAADFLALAVADHEPLLKPDETHAGLYRPNNLTVENGIWR